MIEFIDVSKQFNRKGVTTDALKNVSLKVESGEIFGIVGFSGAGKSTLIRMVNRLESPTKGDVKIAGQSLEKSNTKEIRTIKRDIGMIFQHFNLLDSKEAVVENPKNIKLQPLAPAQIPRSLDDVDAGIINNGIARDAGFNIQKDSIFLEDDTATPYVNIIATKEENKDNETYNRIVELYQDEDTSEFIIEHHKGASIPTKLPLSEIGW